MAVLTNVGPLEHTFYTHVDLFGGASSTLAAERTSGTFTTKGYSQLFLSCFYTYSAATAVIIAVDTSPLASPAATDFVKEWREDSVASGVATMKTATYSFTTGAANQLISLPLPVDNQTARIRISGTSGAAGDIVVVYAALKGWT